MASLKSVLAEYDYVMRQTEKELCRVITARTYKVTKQSGLYKSKNRDCCRPFCVLSAKFVPQLSPTTILVWPLSG